MTAIVCPDTHTWATLLESETSESGTAYAEHLETCTHCQQTLAELAADEAGWQELPRRLPSEKYRASGRFLHREAALESGIVQFKTELPLLLKTEETFEEEMPLSFLRAADRPGLLGYLGEYEVREVLGRGGMGVMFKAFEPALDRLVAIKVMAAAVLVGSATARRRFTREAKAAAAVCHDHIVTVYGVHELNGLPYLVMQYVAGESLQARLERTGPLEVLEIVRIGWQTASGLAAAHAQGLIHRDIKPANLLLEDGLARVRITDFGLARMIDDVPLTRNGELAGTPDYMAPEQARGESVDHRADLFSLGSVLYALCTGKPPFRAASAVAVLRQVSDETPVPIRSLNPHIPAWLETFIARLMAKNPADRFQSARELAALLEGYLAHLRQPAVIAAPILPRTTPKPSSRYRRWLPALALAVVLLGALGMAMGLGVLGGGGLFNMQAEDSEPVKPRRAHVAFDFRTPLDKLPALTLVGPDVDTVAKTDSQGLRITIPAGQQDTRPVSVEMNQRLRGDFDITVGYELLAVGKPVPQYGAGLALRVRFDSPSSLTAIVSRGRKPTGEHYGAHKISDGADGKPQYLNNVNAKATASKGKLRLVRNGSNVEFLVAEEGRDYKTLQVVEFGTADVQQVQLDCFTMYTPISLDVRLTELVIDADQFPDGMPSAPVPPTLSVESPPSSNGWLLAAELLGAVLVVALLIGLGIWLYLRSNGSMEQPATAEAVAPPLSFVCTACGKHLKAKAELAGKKVKCSQCHQAVLVPQIKTAEGSGTSL